MDKYIHMDIGKLMHMLDTEREACANETVFNCVIEASKGRMQNQMICEQVLKFMKRMQHMQPEKLVTMVETAMDALKYQTVVHAEVALECVTDFLQSPGMFAA